MSPLSVSRSRTLSLRAPITNEEERALFQRRLVFTLTTVFVLAFGFWAVQLVAVALTAPQHVTHLFTHVSSRIHICVTSLAIASAGLLRRGKPSARTLDIADGVLVVVICCGWALMIACGDETFPRAELVALLASSYTLAARAALVPSTPARTALVSALSLVPVVPLTIHVNHYGVDRFALGPAVYAAIWAAVGVACTTTISHVIYGLRLEVRRAMQLGQYLLEEKIGEGGMGTVYRASHAMLRRPTAIKLLSGTNAQAAERFEREVQITARLTHPNTIAVFDYGRTPEGVFYYAMEYLEGISLEDLVETHGAQPARRVVHILVQICGALEEAHAADLVHRDIKPANIMLTERGGVPDVVKVLDFGLVKEADGAGIPKADPKTSTANTILGTPHYMAPEAIVDPGKVDARTDLYSLGATAFFLLTGERVFEGGNLVELCSKHLHEPPPAPSSRRAEVPPELDAVVLACLAKKPEDRPTSAADLAARLSALGLEDWSREEAHAWWERTAPMRKAAPRARPLSPEERAHTVAIDLDRRAVG
ncbi:MAG: serine/threonine protein kinase [Deltaproteobacteria bacterium]|nr:serine/threonine protein kinase [Deltaproteobacteria bacterium]